MIGAGERKRGEDCGECSERQASERFHGKLDSVSVVRKREVQKGNAQVVERTRLCAGGSFRSGDSDNRG